MLWEVANELKNRFFACLFPDAKTALKRFLSVIV